MKKSILFIFIILLSTLSTIAADIDWDKLKLVDEIFLQMEYVNDLKAYRRRNTSGIRRGTLNSDPYSDAIYRGVRKLEIMLNHYEKRYHEDFSSKWKYEDWLRENPPY
jgi:hypothetical protein